MDYFAGNSEGMDSFDQRKQDLARQIAARWMERGFTVDYLVMELHLDRKIIVQILDANVLDIETNLLYKILSCEKATGKINKGNVKKLLL